MTTDPQVSEWLKRTKGKAVRYQLARFEEQTQLVQEWDASDQANRNRAELAREILEAARLDCTLQGTTRTERFILRAVGDDGGVCGNMTVVCEPDPDAALQEQLKNEGNLAAAALVQTLRHKEKDQAQQSQATLRALQVLAEANQALAADRQKTNALLFGLLDKIFELKMGALQGVAGDEEDIKAQAWAVSLDKTTDGVITHILPALGNLLDEGTKKMLAEGPKRKRGRPKGSTNGKKKQNGKDATT